MTESKKLGTENLKAVLAFGLALGMAVDKSMADDGKITLADAGNLIPAFMKAPSAFGAAGKSLAELGDLDSEEKAALHAYAKAEFDIHDDDVEEIVENALAGAVEFATIPAILKRRREKQAAPA
jgi:hypothetical protein